MREIKTKAQKFRDLGPVRAQNRRAEKTGARNLLARLGLKIPGLWKPGLQNGRAGRPGPVPIPGLESFTDKRKISVNSKVWSKTWPKAAKYLTKYFKFVIILKSLVFECTKYIHAKGGSVN